VRREARLAFSRACSLLHLVNPIIFSHGTGAAPAAFAGQKPVSKMVDTMRVEVPPAVRNASPGTLIATVVQGDVVLFLRETEFALQRYPAACPVELRLGSWEIDDVLLVALVLRLARSDAATFDCQLDARSPLGIRMLQSLAAQPLVDVHLAGEATVRTFRATNTAMMEAGVLVDRIHSREPWSAEDAEHAMARLNQLYPTARDLWRNSGPSAPR
jgi:hypothetical protein